MQPELEQVKYIYQNVGIEDAGILEGKVKISNKYLFTNLNAFDAFWELIEDGKAIQSGSFTNGQMRTILTGSQDMKSVFTKRMWMNSLLITLSRRKLETGQIHAGLL